MEHMVSIGLVNALISLIPKVTLLSFSVEAEHTFLDYIKAG